MSGISGNAINSTSPILGGSQMNPQLIQAIIASQAPSMMMPQGYGASRFLTGDTGIPLTYGVDVPAYRPFNMTPGPFADFMAAQNFSDPKNPVIPVFDPRTGRYVSSGGAPAPAPVPQQPSYDYGGGGGE